MEHTPNGSVKGLPDNARRPLEPGEEYVPVVPGENVPEITGRSVGLGLVFCAIFAMAAAYLALKVGQGIEAAIPIAILAIGLGAFLKRKSSMLENVIIQSIGANSSHVVSGAVFTIPALYMLAADGLVPAEPSLFQVITVSFLGGCLGVLFLIPLRYHFMVEMHGKFPWPEGTATTEIILSGERAGGSAKILAISAAIGASYDGVIALFRAMREEIHFHSIGLGGFLDKQFMQLKVLNNAAIMGVGYIIGLKYSAIICAGSFLSNFVLVPMIHAIGEHLPMVLSPGGQLISTMGADEVFKSYVRIIGVGGIAGAGILGIMGSMPSMVASIFSNIKGMKSQDKRDVSELKRTEKSLGGQFMLVGLVIFVVLAFVFFSFGLGIDDSFVFALAAVALVTVIAFLFAPVAARAIAIVGTNPVSGMTMLTLIVTGFVMLKLNITGGTGMFITMMVGGVVCTALAASGALASDLKVGHWIGATPSKQLQWKFVGTAVAAIFTGIAMWGLSKGADTFGSSALPAPQASAMKEILIGIFASSSPLQWYLFALGVLLAIILRMTGIPALAFALGMYLPMELNTPVMIGGFLAYLTGRHKVGEEKLSKARHERGVLVASGLVAGGAIAGVLISLVGAAIVETTGKRELMQSLWIFGSDHAGLGDIGEIVTIAVLAVGAFLFVRYNRAAKVVEE